MIRIVTLCVTAVLGSAEALAQEATRATNPPAEKPWRLHEAIGAPSWLRFGIEPRARYEYLANDFRAAATGNSSALFLRTLLSAELKFSPLIASVELQDGRAYGTDATPLSNALVNAVEIVQAYAGLRREGLFTDGDSSSLTLGRFTMDVGSRRLITRNQFRNTVNSFTGIDLQWTGPERNVMRGFAVVPVIRRPSDPAKISDNVIELDRENTDALFWGVFLASVPVARAHFESYVFGLHEGDGMDTPSANRRFYTPGVRLYCPPAPGQLDFEVEAMIQVGTSRATTQATDARDLKHRALSVHATGGYRFDMPWSPRLALHYDYASGDANPGDAFNGRFDQLFDERRVDFGPVGLYGAFLRSNISSPGGRVEVAPHPTIDAFAHYQLVWLASARDAWPTAGLRDASGASGRFVGHQIEGRIRWTVFPKNLSIEVVGAYLKRGEFATGAANAKAEDPALIYTQITVTI